MPESSLGEMVEEIIDRKKAGTLTLLQDWAGTLEGHAKMGASWRDQTAHARQSLHAGAERSGDKFTLYLSHGMEYGVYLETGTPPHIIKPKNKKALAFTPVAAMTIKSRQSLYRTKKGGLTKSRKKAAVTFAKKVHHPGTKPYPIVGPTMEAYIGRIEKTVLDWWTE